MSPSRAQCRPLTLYVCAQIEESVNCLQLIALIDYIRYYKINSSPFVRYNNINIDLAEGNSALLSTRDKMHCHPHWGQYLYTDIVVYCSIWNNTRFLNSLFFQKKRTGFFYNPHYAYWTRNWDIVYYIKESQLDSATTIEQQKATSPVHFIPLTVLKVDANLISS